MLATIDGFHPQQKARGGDLLLTLSRQGGKNLALQGGRGGLETRL